MAIPYQALAPLPPAVFSAVRLRAIFECHKWDPQVGDTAILSDFPLLLERQEWQRVAALAQQLAIETLEAEREIMLRPELHARLGLPAAIRRLWKQPMASNPQDVRLMRFDFHFTTEGWRISEVNADVPGGFNEASGFTRLMADQYPGTAATGDPAAALAQAIALALGKNADPAVALIHATAYTDDRQIMVYLQDSLRQVKLTSCLASPAQLDWTQGAPRMNTDWRQGNVDFILRFFPAEWLPKLRRGWTDYFTSGQCPACNPTSALLVQSKRFPLLWDELHTPLPTWQSLLPETRDPRSMHGLERASSSWLIKPAWGRIGENIAMQGASPAKEWRRLRRKTWFDPRRWVFQRRFATVPVHAAGQDWYPCIGVYTVNGKAVGAYGRMATQPIITSEAKDVAILSPAEN